MSYLNEIYPTQFFFYFKNKRDARKLVPVLEGKGFFISDITKSFSDDEEWLLLAEKELIGDESGFDYYEILSIYAELFNGTYDGHETMIKM